MSELAAQRLAFRTSAVSADRLTRVVDVGTNPLEDPAHLPLLRVGGCQLWGFERQPTAFEKLQAAKSENETYYAFAVCDGGDADLNVHRGSGFTLFKIDNRAAGFLGFQRQTQLAQQTAITTRRLDDIEDLPPCDLLKIDIQGGEVEVFHGGPMALRDAVAIIPKVRFYRLYNHETMFAGIDQALRSMGFALHKIMASKSIQVRHSRMADVRPRRIGSQLVDGDAVYIRNTETPERISDDQWHHLAILSDSVFQSFDLILHCLDHLVARGLVEQTAIDAYVDLLPGSLVLAQRG